MVKVEIDHGILGYYARISIKVDNVSIDLNDGQSMNSDEIASLIDDLYAIVEYLKTEKEFLAAGEADREYRRKMCIASKAKDEANK